MYFAKMQLITTILPRVRKYKKAWPKKPDPDDDDKKTHTQHVRWTINLETNQFSIVFFSSVASNELVFINFYAEWCRFSNILQPIFDEAADKVRDEFTESGKVVMGKVDCDKEGTIASRFQISKYPTLKVIRNGTPTKREYRGKPLFKFKFFPSKNI